MFPSSFLPKDPEKRKKAIKNGVTGIVITVLTIGAYFFQSALNTGWFQASLLGIGGTPEPFDGTVYPIEKTLNWVKLSSNQYLEFKSGTFDYDKAKSAGKLIDIPEYNTTTLSNDPATLGWSGSDLDIRNVLLTYVTAYLGAYTGGSEAAIENNGSHLAIDIRAPKGTPILSIANGKVIKVKEDSSNGNTVVIEHKDVPSLDNPEIKTTYYSSYLHLNRIDVLLGQVVTKGTQIGTVGKTGLATTHHLHFQIDKEEAPFHPYWPFTWSDVSDAGLDFFSAVNESLGFEKAQTLTIHPFTWIHEYINGYGEEAITNEVITDSTEDVVDTTTTDTESSTIATTDSHVNLASTDTEDSSETDTVVIPASVEKFVLKADKSELKGGETTNVIVTAVDKDGNIVTSFTPSDPVNIDNSSDGTTSTTTIPSFSNGVATFSYTASGASLVTLNVKSGNILGSLNLEVSKKEEVNTVVEATKLSISHTTKAYVGEQVEVTISGIDNNGNSAPAGVSNTIMLTAEGGKANLSKSLLSFADFTDNTATIKLTPIEEGTIALVARSGTISGTGPILSVSEAPETGFADVTANHKHATAINYLKKKGVIAGYNDNTFRPDQIVNRAEDVKIILGGSGISPLLNIGGTSFPDVSIEEWFAGWIQKAKELGVVQGNPDGTFDPGGQVTLAAHIKILLLTNKIDLNEVAVMENPFNDADASEWYAVFLQYAKDKNLIEADAAGNINPGGGVSRGVVAESMYRLMRIKETGATKYSSALDK